MPVSRNGVALDVSRNGQSLAVSHNGRLIHMPGGKPRPTLTVTPAYAVDGVAVASIRWDFGGLGTATSWDFQDAGGGSRATNPALFATEAPPLHGDVERQLIATNADGTSPPAVAVFERDFPVEIQIGTPRYPAQKVINGIPRKRMEVDIRIGGKPFPTNMTIAPEAHGASTSQLQRDFQYAALIGRFKTVTVTMIRLASFVGDERYVVSSGSNRSSSAVTGTFTASW